MLLDDPHRLVGITDPRRLDQLPVLGTERRM